MGACKAPTQSGPPHHEQFLWAIRGVQSHFDMIHAAWAHRFGVTTPQLLLVFALRDFDHHGTGLPVKEVAKLLGVDPTFATTQSKLLETKGFVSRKTSDEDARVVRLSLTDKSVKQLDHLSTRQKKIHDYIFSEFTDQGLHALVAKVLAVKNKMERASAVASIDLDD